MAFSPIMNRENKLDSLAKGIFMQFYYVPMSKPGFHEDKIELSATRTLNKWSELTA